MKHIEPTGIPTAELVIDNVRVLARRITQLEEDLKAAQRVVLSLAARVAAQSEILARSAEQSRNPK
jgi:hypothetical protein